MLRKFLILFLMGLFLLGVIGCGEDDDEEIIKPIAYVLNGLAATISVINTDDTVVNDAISLGTWPNDLILDDGQDRIYVVNSGDNNIQIIDTDEMITIGTIDVGVGSNPYSMALIDNNQGIVTKLLTNSVALIDLANNTVLDTLAVGSAPEGIVVKDGNAYVANSAYGFGNGTISVIDIANWSVTQTIEVGVNPQTVFFDIQGELNIICTGDYGDIKGHIYVVDITSNTVKTSFEMGGYPSHYAIDDKGIAYITAAGGWPIGEPGYLMSYDTVNEAALHPASDPLVQMDNLFGLGSHQSNENLWICQFGDDHILEIDPEDGTINQQFSVGDGPQIIRFVD